MPKFAPWQPVMKIDHFKAGECATISFPAQAPYFQTECPHCRMDFRTTKEEVEVGFKVIGLMLSILFGSQHLMRG